MSNPYGKRRDVSNPYFTLTQAGWEWKVLKIYSKPAKSLSDPYSRAHCFVTSPFCPSGEYGDVYVRDVPGLAGQLIEFERRQIREELHNSQQSD